MKKMSKEAYTFGNVRVTLTNIQDNSPRLHDYGLSHSMWVRASLFIDHLGVDEALRAMDERAERAFARGDLRTCMLWRDLMAGVHAIASDEPLPGDRIH